MAEWPTFIFAMNKIIMLNELKNKTVGIKELEKSKILPNVLDYEPHLALFVPDNDPLLFYRCIAIFAQQHLKPKGKLYFEINRTFGVETVELLTDLGFCNVELRKDISGNDRMIRSVFSVISDQ